MVGGWVGGWWVLYFFYNVLVGIQLCSYNLCEYFSQYLRISLVQFAATRRWLGTTAGTYSVCVLQFHHHVFFHIYPYVRTSFSGPCRCVWVSRLYFFDARNPALIFVYLGGSGYAHLRGLVSRFGGTRLLTRDPKLNP